VVEPGLGASARQARRVWAKAQDVIVREARQLQRAGVVEDQGKAHGLVADVLALESHDARAAPVKPSKSQRVDLSRVRHRDRPSTFGWIKKQLHKWRRATSIGEAHAPRGVVDHPVKAQRLAAGGDLGLGFVDRLVVGAKPSILAIESGPHAHRVWGAPSSRPSAGHTHPRAVGQRKQGTVAVRVADGVLVRDHQLMGMATDGAATTGVSVGLPFGRSGRARQRPDDVSWCHDTALMYCAR